MFIQIINYVYGLLIALVVFVLWIALRALFWRNKKTKKIIIDSGETSDYHKERLFELIQIDTPSFIEGESYESFKEKINQLFPLLHKFMKKTKIEGNTIYSYKSKNKDASSVLFSSHIDYIGEHQEAYIDGERVYGNGTFDSKSLLYTIFEAVESVFKENEKLEVDLTIVITNDDEAKKDGIKEIIYQFLRRGNFFNLVIEEGSGIVGPEAYGIKSNYALIGLGVSGQICLRFESKKYSDLVEFVNEVNKPRIFKMKIDKKSMKIVKNIARDLTFKDRFFLNNTWLFKRKASRIIEDKYNEIEKVLKTTVNIGEIETNDNLNYVHVIFELSTHDKSADILIHLGNLMEKHDVDYKIIEIKEASEITKTYTYGYKLVKNAINNVFKDLYIAPVIVTNKSELRYFDQVSDCVIRFSPLYYDYESFMASKTNKNYINSSSIDYGVKFYKYILMNYNKKK